MRTPLLAFALVLLAAPVFAQSPPAAAAAKSEDVTLGSGRHTYRWVKDWLKLPAGMENLGSTHGGIAFDSQGRVFFSTDTANAIVIVDRDGRWLGAWGSEIGAGLHGLQIRQEGAQEFLYAVHLGRHSALKFTLDGKIVWEVPYPEKSGIYKDAGQYAPTGIAVLPDGGFVVADGYGTSWLHLFDKDQKYVKSFGGPGTELGKFQTCHGLCLDLRGEKPLLLIADRANARLQHFDLDGNPVKVYAGDLRMPCLANVANGDGDVVVPDLKGRVTIFDREMKLVCQLGDNEDETLRGNFGVKREQWRDGQFTAPHGAAWDRDGNLYVMDWNVLGRVTKLERVKPAK